LSIEGHTDSRPYGKQNYTNWELSSDRANAARRLMDSLGLKPGQIAEVRGYADRRLFNTQDPNDYKNRRVSILVRSLEKDKEKPLVITPSPGNGGKKIEPPVPEAKPVTPPTPPVLPALTPPAAPALPAQKPPPPPEKAKTEVGPTPGADKAKTATAQAPPPGPKETKPERGPLEDNLNLQKEILNLGPKTPPITIK
jgi:chemotaxis protein MotB